MSVIEPILGHLLSPHAPTILDGLGKMERLCAEDGHFAGVVLTHPHALAALHRSLAHSTACCAATLNTLAVLLEACPARQSSARLPLLRDLLHTHPSSSAILLRALSDLSDDGLPGCLAALRLLTIAAQYAPKMMLARWGGTPPLHLACFRPLLTYAQRRVRWARVRWYLQLANSAAYGSARVSAEVLCSHGFLTHLLTDAAELLRQEGRDSLPHVTLAQETLRVFVRRFLHARTLPAPRKRDVLLGQRHVLRLLVRALDTDGGVAQAAAAAVYRLVSALHESPRDYAGARVEALDAAEATGVVGMPNFVLFVLLRHLRPSRSALASRLVVFILCMAPDLIRPYFARVSGHLAEADTRASDTSAAGAVSATTARIATLNCMTRLFLAPAPYHLTAQRATLQPIAAKASTFYAMSARDVVEEICPAWVAGYVHRIINGSSDGLMLALALQTTTAALRRAEAVMRLVRQIHATRHGAPGRARRACGVAPEERDEDWRERELAAAAEEEEEEEVLRWRGGDEAEEESWRVFESQVHLHLAAALPSREEFWHRMTQQIHPQWVQRARRAAATGHETPLHERASVPTPHGGDRGDADDDVEAEGQQPDTSRLGATGRLEEEEEEEFCPVAHASEPRREDDAALFLTLRMFVLMQAYSRVFRLRLSWLSAVPSHIPVLPAARCPPGLAGSADAPPRVVRSRVAAAMHRGLDVLDGFDARSISALCGLLVHSLSVGGVSMTRLHHITMTSNSRRGGDAITDSSHCKNKSWKSRKNEYEPSVSSRGTSRVAMTEWPALLSILSWGVRHRPTFCDTVTGAMSHDSQEHVPHGVCSGDKGSNSPDNGRASNNYYTMRSYTTTDSNNDKNNNKNNSDDNNNSNNNNNNYNSDKNSNTTDNDHGTSDTINSVTAESTEACAAWAHSRRCLSTHAVLCALGWVGRLVQWTVHSVTVRFGCAYEEALLWVLVLDVESLPCFLHALNSVLQRSLSKAAGRVAEELFGHPFGVVYSAVEYFCRTYAEKEAARQVEQSSHATSIQRQHAVNKNNTDSHGKTRARAEEDDPPWVEDARMYVTHVQKVTMARVRQCWPHRHTLVARLCAAAVAAASTAATSHLASHTRTHANHDDGTHASAAIAPTTIAMHSASESELGAVAAVLSATGSEVDATTTTTTTLLADHEQLTLFCRTRRSPLRARTERVVQMQTQLWTLPWTAAARARGNSPSSHDTSCVVGTEGENGDTERGACCCESVRDVVCRMDVLEWYHTPALSWTLAGRMLRDLSNSRPSGDDGEEENLNRRTIDCRDGTLVQRAEAMRSCVVAFVQHVIHSDARAALPEDTESSTALGFFVLLLTSLRVLYTILTTRGGGSSSSSSESEHTAEGTCLRDEEQATTTASAPLRCPRPQRTAAQDTSRTASGWVRTGMDQVDYDALSRFILRHYSATLNTIDRVRYAALLTLHHLMIPSHEPTVRTSNTNDTRQGSSSRIRHARVALPLVRQRYAILGHVPFPTQTAEVDALSFLLDLWTAEEIRQAALECPAELHNALPMSSSSSSPRRRRQQQQQQPGACILVEELLQSVYPDVPMISSSSSISQDSMVDGLRVRAASLSSVSCAHVIDPRYLLPLVYTVLCLPPDVTAHSTRMHVSVRCLPFLLRALSFVDPTLRVWAAGALACASMPAAGPTRLIVHMATLKLIHLTQKQQNQQRGRGKNHTSRAAAAAAISASSKPPAVAQTRNCRQQQCDEEQYAQPDLAASNEEAKTVANPSHSDSKQSKSHARCAPAAVDEEEEATTCLALSCCSSSLSCGAPDVIGESDCYVPRMPAPLSACLVLALRPLGRLEDTLHNHLINFLLTPQRVCSTPVPFAAWLRRFPLGVVGNVLMHREQLAAQRTSSSDGAGMNASSSNRHMRNGAHEKDRRVPCEVSSAALVSSSAADAAERLRHETPPQLDFILDIVRYGCQTSSDVRALIYSESLQNVMLLADLLTGVDELRVRLLCCLLEMSERSVWVTAQLALPGHGLVWVLSFLLQLCREYGSDSPHGYSGLTFTTALRLLEQLCHAVQVTRTHVLPEQCSQMAHSTSAHTSSNTMSHKTVSTHAATSVAAATAWATMTDMGYDDVELLQQHVGSQLDLLEVMLIQAKVTAKETRDAVERVRLEWGVFVSARRALQCRKRVRALASEHDGCRSSAASLSLLPNAWPE